MNPNHDYLFDYQLDFVNAVAKGFASGFRRQLGVMPTGAGKTPTAAAVAWRFASKRNERTLFLAHREELIDQAADKIGEFTGLATSVEKAERRGNTDSQVVIASIQTLQNDRLKSWAQDHFGLIIVDEAHHTLAKSYLNILDHFPSSRLLGVTATPDRGDRKSLAKIYENLAYEISILELIAKKRLSPLRIQSVPIKIDIAQACEPGKDYDAEKLGSAIEPYLGAIAASIREHCADRKRIVAFLPTIATSKKFVAECNAAGLNFVHVDGGSKDRHDTLAAFSRGDYGGISNVALLTEGWDEKEVDCVLVLRPTKSRALFAQMIGRGMRFHPNKPNCLFLDILWLHEKHNLIKPASLVAKNKEEEEAITRQLEKKDQDLDQAVSAAEMEREAALIRQIAENARRQARNISVEEVGAVLKDQKIRDYEPVFKWEMQPITPKQKELLSRFGVNCQSKGEASMIMNRLFDRSKAKLATVKQLQWLIRMKHPSPETCSQKDAKKFLDELWKKK